MVEESTQKIFLLSWMFANCRDFLQVSYILASVKQPMSSSLGIVFVFSGATKDLTIKNREALVTSVL